MILSVELTPVEEKALKYVAADPQEWFANFVQHRARIAIQEIYDLEVAKAKADPNTTHIPVNIEDVVLAADIKSAAEQMAAMPPPMANLL